MFGTGIGKGLFGGLGGTDPCCDNEPQGYWTVNGGYYYLKTFFGSNPGLFSSGTSGGTKTITQFDVNNDMRRCSHRVCQLHVG